MKKVFLLVLIILVLGAVVATVSADPVGGCPKSGGWFLVIESATIICKAPPCDVGNFHDQNGDGYICAKESPGRVGAWVVRDNNNPLP